MVDLNPYKVIWKSHIDPGSPERVEEFDTQNAAENFILSLKVSKSREFVWCNFERKV